jgi:hypothetical protein
MENKKFFEIKSVRIESELTEVELQALKGGLNELKILSEIKVARDGDGALLVCCTA